MCFCVLSFLGVATSRYLYVYKYICVCEVVAFVFFPSFILGVVTSMYRCVCVYIYIYVLLFGVFGFCFGIVISRYLCIYIYIYLCFMVGSF